MKKLIMVALATVTLFGCSDPADGHREHEIKKLAMQQQHEQEMARIQANVNHVPGVRYEGTGNEYHPSPSAPQPVDYGTHDSNPVDNGSESSLLGTVATLGAGALAGYAISELLDDGHRSYTDNQGRTRYVDGSGKEISSQQYNEYKKKHPTKHNLSQYNQKGKAVVNTAKTKTVEAASVAKTKTVEAAKKVDQKVVKPVQKKVSSYKSSSKRR